MTTLNCTRRSFISMVSAGTAGAAFGQRTARAPGTPPNILLVLTDQQSLDTISALNVAGISTPHMDRLMARGVTFTESYCTGALCSPTRSSILTGRMPSETGVFRNGLSIREGMPNLGQMMRTAGYDTYYAGKWHLPFGYTWHVPGFDVISAGTIGQGHYMDSMATRACEAFLTTRQTSRPYFLFVNYLQPHDICQFGTNRFDLKDDPQFVDIAHELPPLPPNHYSAPSGEHGSVINARRKTMGIWSEDLWRYYSWAYDRMVEQVDAELGRLLDALDSSGLDQNTVVIFTSDHGEGRGRHGLITKNFLYEEATRVPMIVSWPGHTDQGKVDATHLVNSIDIMPTLCDYAGIDSPPTCGHSFRPFCEGKEGPSHEVAVTEVRTTGRSVRTTDYKYIEYFGTDNIQLFDLKNDPWEMENLAEHTQYASVLADHARLLRDWERHMDPVPLAAVPWDKPLEKARRLLAGFVIELEGTVIDDIVMDGGIGRAGHDRARPRFSVSNFVAPGSFTVSFTAQEDGALALRMPVWTGPITLTALRIEGLSEQRAPNLENLSAWPVSPWRATTDEVELVETETGQTALVIPQGTRLMCGNIGDVRAGQRVTLTINIE